MGHGLPSPLSSWPAAAGAVASVIVAEVLLTDVVFSAAHYGLLSNATFFSYCFTPTACYSGYPSSMLLAAVALLFAAALKPTSALPFMAFSVSAGELLFTVETMPTALYPPHDVFDLSNFNPYLTVIWAGAVVIGAFVLWQQGHRPRFTRWFVLWFAVCTAVQFFEPYQHTTWPELLLSDALIAWQFWVFWRVFELDRK